MWPTRRSASCCSTTLAVVILFQTVVMIGWMANAWLSWLIGRHAGHPLLYRLVGNAPMVERTLAGLAAEPRRTGLRSTLPRSLSELAQRVAEELTARDALDAHARDELGITETRRPRPIQAALASAAAFATTHWSLVLAAGDLQQQEVRQALSTLCEIYWLPLYAYVDGPAAKVQLQTLNICRDGNLWSRETEARISHREKRVVAIAKAVPK